MGRVQIRMKKYTLKILQLQAKSGLKPKMSKILVDMIDRLDKKEILKASGNFRLSEYEADFIEERAREKSLKWGSVWVPFEDYFEILENYSKKSGIPKWKIVDHMVRLIRDLKIYSGDKRGWKRFNDAIEGRGKLKLKEIQVLEAEPFEEIPAVVERGVSPLKVVARNRVYPLLKLKPIPIKLKLKIENVPVSIQKTLHNYYRWNEFNVDEEISPFMIEIELNRNPLNRELIKKNTTNSFTFNIFCDRYLYKYNSEFSDKKKIVKHVYELLGLKWSYPPWMKVMDQLIDLYRISKNYRKLKDMNFTNGEFFEKYGVELPDIYRGQEDEIVSTFEDLERLGIAESLDLKIKELLKIEDEFEYALIHYEELEEWEKIQIETKVRWEFKDHEYAQLLREKIARERSSENQGSLNDP